MQSLASLPTALTSHFATANGRCSGFRVERAEGDRNHNELIAQLCLFLLLEICDNKTKKVFVELILAKRVAFLSRYATHAKSLFGRGRRVHTSLFFEGSEATHVDVLEGSDAAHVVVFEGSEATHVVVFARMYDPSMYVGHKTSFFKKL